MPFLDALIAARPDEVFIKPYGTYSVCDTCTYNVRLDTWIAAERNMIVGGSEQTRILNVL